jgi:hypothetical protein
MLRYCSKTPCNCNEKKQHKKNEPNASLGDFCGITITDTFNRMAFTDSPTGPCCNSAHMRDIICCMWIMYQAQGDCSCTWHLHIMHTQSHSQNLLQNPPCPPLSEVRSLHPRNSQKEQKEVKAHHKAYVPNEVPPTTNRVSCQTRFRSTSKRPAGSDALREILRLEL